MIIGRAAAVSPAPFGSSSGKGTTFSVVASMPCWAATALPMPLIAAELGLPAALAV